MLPIGSVGIFMSLIGTFVFVCLGKEQNACQSAYALPTRRG